MTTNSRLWALVAGAVFAPAVVAAQPDPFLNYGQAKGPTPAVMAPDAPIPPHFARGDWAVGFGSAFSFTTATNDLVDGTSRSNSTLFTRMAPTLGWFVRDNLEVTFSPGLLVQQLDRGSEASTELAWLMEAGARYWAPLTERFALMAGLGLGGYFGRSNRTLTVTETVEEGAAKTVDVNEQTSTAGFSVAGRVGAGYFFDPALQLQVTLDANWLIGRESIDSVDESLSTSTVHVGLGLALAYYF